MNMARLLTFSLVIFLVHSRFGFARLMTPASFHHHDDNKKNALALEEKESAMLAKYHAALEERETRVLAGVEAEIDEFPFFVRWDWSCGGALIHEDIFVTSAHCTELNNFFEDFDVYINAHEDPTRRRQSPSEGLPMEQRRVVTGRMHPESQPFRRGNYQPFLNDVAVVKIDQASTLPLVPLNTLSDQPEDSEELTIVENDWVYPLHKVTVSALSHTDCADAYDDFAIAVLEDKMLCGAAVNSEDSSCTHVEGVPVLEERDGEDILVAIASSMGVGCQDDGVPGLNTRVSAYVPWIMEQVCLLSSNPPASCPPIPDDAIPLRMDIWIDSVFALDAHWSITQSGETLYWSHGWQEGFVSERIYLSPGEYTFEIENLVFDGNYTLVAEMSAGDVVVGQGDRPSSAVTFELSPEATPEPGPNRDDDDCTDTDSVLCEWLGENVDEFGYLCALVDVAAACPLTCDMCALFACQ